MLGDRREEGPEGNLKETVIAMMDGEEGRWDICWVAAAVVGGPFFITERKRH